VKVCSKCRMEQPSECFGKNRWHSDGLASQCRKCTNLTRLKSYRNNQEKVLRACAARNSRGRRFLARVKMKLGCVDCGYKAHPAALDFDHVRGTKKFKIANSVSRSMKDLKIEIRKCEVRCANCHRIQTSNRTAVLLPREQRPLSSGVVA
jgi:hypothetical protein